ncbi:MAG: DUF4149 domain-containing protein [Methylophilaceae bacterium]|nr:DUF4149 domain-containing protein [Methylophilaceae bacterium]MBL6728588.1 DUF4149 domain-containing protein [Methylophilaceae bacterium]
MSSFLKNLNIIIATLWIGGLWTMLMVTIILFEKIPSSYIAGNLAADMFQFMNYFGFASAIFIILTNFKLNRFKFLKESVFWLLLLITSLILLNYFGIQPLLDSFKVDALPKEVMESVFADRFSTWHGIASISYLIECILGILLILKIR